MPQGKHPLEVLILSPESPYPLAGGGAFRTASLLHYFARFAQVDLILISDSGKPALLPPGLVRSQQVIRLNNHNRGVVSRYIRNARRAIQGVPPLIDRLAGLTPSIERAIGGRHYDFGLVEHFWCAPYINLLEKFCSEVALDLHNIESVLHERCAVLSREPENRVTTTLGEKLIQAGHHRFAAASRKLESALLPRYSAVLATSRDDALLIQGIAPKARVQVYPNSLPMADAPDCPESHRLVFSGNFEYHPNIDAVAFLVSEIWPKVRKLHPDLRLRLVGRGDSFIRHLLPVGPVEKTGIEVTGPVEDARSEIARARLVIAPLRVGSGTRLKILEGWAAARCVVATPLAAEGLAAEDGINIAIALNSTDFAATVTRLLDDSVTRNHLAAAGRGTFINSYCWEIAWKSLDNYLQLTRRTGLNGYTGNF